MNWSIFNLIKRLRDVEEVNQDHYKKLALLDYEIYALNARLDELQTRCNCLNDLLLKKTKRGCKCKKSK
jgi:hypothetical protein